MPDLTPIPTAYNGHLFRSRLEARWAVFFDTMGWRYAYEAEGYDLEGKWYLPDFWFPAFNCWIEIKPDSPETYDAKALLLAAKSEKRVLVIRGNPWPEDYGIYLCAPKMYLFDIPWVWTLGEVDDEEVWLWSDPVGAIALNPNDNYRSTPAFPSRRINDALLAARSARFEHGESGRTL